MITPPATRLLVPTGPGLLLMGLLLMGLLLMAGCASSPPTNFYTLSPLALPSLGEDAHGALADTTLGVGPVTLPDYLDRPQIVTRSGENRLEVDEFHRWGGSLEEDVTRTLVQNLSRLLASNRVRAYPSPEPLDLRYRVFIDVQRLDGQLGEGLTLDAFWTLMDEQSGEPLLMQRFEHRAATPGDDYQALVAAHSDALAALSLILSEALASRR